MISAKRISAVKHLQCCDSVNCWKWGWILILTPHVPRRWKNPLQEMTKLLSYACKAAGRATAQHCADIDWLMVTMMPPESRWRFVWAKWRLGLGRCDDPWAQQPVHSPSGCPSQQQRPTRNRHTNTDPSKRQKSATRKRYITQRVSIINVCNMRTFCRLNKETKRVPIRTTLATSFLNQML